MTGVPGAILGVGLDTFGLWPQMFEGRSGGYPGGFPAAYPGSFNNRVSYNVTLRGPGDGTADTNTGILVGGQLVPNYGFLVSTGALADQSLLSLDAGLAAPSAVRPNEETGPAFREAEIFVDTTQIPSGHLPVTVSIIEGTTGAQTVLGTFDIYQQLLQFYGSAANFPKSVHFGFSGGTGDFTQFHDIRLVEVETTDQVGPDLSILKEHYPSEFVRGSTGTYYILVANESLEPTFGQVTVTDTIPTGLVAH